MSNYQGKKTRWEVGIVKNSDFLLTCPELEESVIVVRSVGFFYVRSTLDVRFE